MFEKRTGEVIINQLLDWGVDHIYGLPGDSINEFIEDLRKNQKYIKFIQVRHEEVAALSAASYAKLTGKIGVCTAIAGPGAIHLLNGMYDAKEDGVPMLVIAGQVHSEELGTESFQEINLERMFDDVAVFNKTVTTETHLPDLLNQAIRTAYAEKGVAVLTIPDNIVARKYKNNKSELSSSVRTHPKIFPGETDLMGALDLIHEAKKPVILAGKGALFAREELLTFAEQIAAPIILTLAGKGVIPDEHPYCMGQLGQIGTKPAYQAAHESDLLILIGTSFPYRQYLPNGVKALQIDIDPTKISKRYPIDVGLVGDTKEVLGWLNQRVKRNENRFLLEKSQERMNKWWHDMNEDQEKESEHLKGSQVVGELQKFVKDDAILSVDIGNVTVWMARYFRMTNQKFITSCWLATMGCGLPGAIAAKMAFPERQALAVCGDGGFTMVMHDFVTAVRYKLPIVVVVLNNEKLGMIKYEQESLGHQDYAVDLAEMNFAAFAEACGGVGYRVTNRAELREALGKAALDEKPVIIDCVTDIEPPLPGKITYQQAVHYSEYLIKSFFSEGKLELPPIKKGIKGLF
ncbi:pyruvate oxidase [Priestia koreensis]|uniref:pyruvate oxidase n=1 Tax=Priestia koreensis TaxID=284581 RepID=UPI001F577319|nr:pyruvate oxidase [Priestia koreensis]UNL83588.1 pyruvate oxidase [Priestia koreensis]